MRDLAVAAVADDRRFEERGWLALIHSRQEMAEPGGELVRMRARHAHRLDQRRGEEFVAAGFPRLAVAVSAEPMQRSAANEVGKRSIEALGPLECQDQGEARVEVRADADR